MARWRPIGRDNQAVQHMLAGLVDVAKAADDLGYWAITHVEHHFHSEGLEYSPSPLLFNVWLGTQTKRLRLGQLGLVLTAHDPIRLAELLHPEHHTDVAVQTHRHIILRPNGPVQVYARRAYQVVSASHPFYRRPRT